MLEAAALTDPGRVREMNEDRIWSQVYSPSEGKALGLFIVCDGMGGHLGGECASHWAVETVKQELIDLFSLADPRATIQLSEQEINAAIDQAATRKTDASRYENRLRNAVLRANQVVYEYAQRKPEKAGDAGTTISMALLYGYLAVIANVGDSRTYLLRENQLRQLTRDHSLVARLVEKGQLSPQEIYSHPQRNVIYRALGLKKTVEVDTFVEILQPGDQLLLCSDGLWEMVRDEETIINILRSSPKPLQACTQLIDAANSAGGEDNIGVVVVHVS